MNEPLLRRAFCMSRRPTHRQAAERFLTEVETIDSRGVIALLRAQAIIGWGHKRAFLAARIIAKLKRVPYVCLEDGFLRSVGLGKDGVAPHSLIVDFRGIYYDARKPSDLEQLLQEPGWENEDLLRQADRAIALLRHHGLTKYNVAPSLAPDRLGLPAETRRVLVIDQVRGDASIPGALASAGTFALMLRAALTENPLAEVLVKLHPDVLAGKRQGHLGQAAGQDARVRLLPYDINPWSLFPLVERVYTVSSQTGVEALMAERPVTCFGLPFYAGWGLTDDRLTLPRRTRQRSLRELIAASYLVYARYADPVTGHGRSFEETVAALVALLPRVANPGPAAGAGARDSSRAP